jgi:DNA-binding transcriptional ArsR family regulator
MPKRNGSGIALLADPTRRRLVALLAIRPRRPSGLAAEIGLSRPATARQLHLLEEAGLIRASRFMIDRRSVLYAIDPRMHGPITAWLAGTEIARPSNGPADRAEPPTSPSTADAHRKPDAQPADPQPADAHRKPDAQHADPQPADAHRKPDAQHADPQPADAHRKPAAHRQPSDAHRPPGDAPPR